MVYARHAIKQEPGYPKQFSSYIGGEYKLGSPLSLLFFAGVVGACVALPGGFPLLFAAGGSAAATAAAAACCRMTLDPPSATLGIAGSSSELAALCFRSHSLICMTPDDITFPYCVVMGSLKQMPHVPCHDIHMIISSAIVARTASCTNCVTSWDLNMGYLPCSECPHACCDPPAVPPQPSQPPAPHDMPSWPLLECRWLFASPQPFWHPLHVQHHCRAAGRQPLYVSAQRSLRSRVMEYPSLLGSIRRKTHSWHRHLDVSDMQQVFCNLEEILRSTAMHALTPAPSCREKAAPALLLLLHALLQAGPWRLSAQ